MCQSYHIWLRRCKNKSKNVRWLTLLDNAVSAPRRVNSGYTYYEDDEITIIKMLLINMLRTLIVQKRYSHHSQTF